MTAVDSPEKILFASTTQAFLHKEVPLSRVRDLHSQGIAFEPAWWQRAAELGWTALLVPEELGGGSVSGDGFADLAMVAEQLGKTVAPGPLFPVSVVLAALVESAEPQAHADTIESLIAGETVASWAVYEPGQGWAPHEPSVTATATDAGYRIDGVKDAQGIVLNGRSKSVGAAVEIAIELRSGFLDMAVDVVCLQVEAVEYAG